MNLTTFLETSAQKFPDKTAVRFEGQGVTYAELNASCNRLAAGLQNMGLTAGDRCALMMPNSIDAMVAYNALAKLGAVIVPINFTYRQHELSHIFTDSRPRAFIGAAADGRS